MACVCLYFGYKYLYRIIAEYVVMKQKHTEKKPMKIYLLLKGKTIGKLINRNDWGE